LYLAFSTSGAATVAAASWACDATGTAAKAARLRIEAATA
jgi:hypothetical protein